MAEKFGVYLCEGCDIGGRVDLESIAELLSNIHGDAAPVVKTNPILCSPEGVEEIKKDIEENELEGVCLCACSPRSKWDVFSFPGKQVERVNLREHCVWSYQEPLGHVEDQMQHIARDYCKMGCMRLLRTKNPEPEIPETSDTILVLGGGFTGLNSALYCAKMGHDVILVEKSDRLGGKAADMHKTIPLSYPHVAPHDTGIEEKIAEVEGNGKIRVLKGSTLKKVIGAPGTYDVTLATGGGEEQARIGSIILATGWQAQDPSVLAPLGYGKMKNVVTMAEFERMAKDGNLVRPSDSKPAKRVAFVLETDLCKPKELELEEAEACAAGEPADAVGEAAGEDAVVDLESEYKHPDMENYKHLPYSLGVNSLVALKQAGYVREKYADDGVGYVFYDHMVVPGIHERYYKAAQDNPGIMMTKARIAEIREEGDGSLVVQAEDTLFGPSIEVPVDMAVLPTGIVPTTAKEQILSLEYRQGPTLPDMELFDGFADSNYICFPYETRRTGVYAAGCVRQPMMMDAADDDAAGAALKAIQCIRSANRGVAVHPRSGDLTFPVFNFVRCTQCKRCTEECPFGALDDDEKGTPKPNPTRCRRCGTCMGACPERVISFDNYSVSMVGEMIKQYDVPDDIETGGPRVLILACENDACPALDMAAMKGTSWSPYVRIIPVRCLGSVNAIWVADAMSKGTDGVMLLGCKYGDDYQCHFMKGSELCNRRKENIAESLNRLGIDADRVEQYQVSIDEYDKIPEIVDEFLKMILEKGPNPFKGF